MAITVDILQYGTGSHLTSSEAANGVATDFISEGVVGTFTSTGGVAPATGAFAVNAQGTPDTTVAVSAGTAYVTGTPTSQGSQTLRVVNSASTNVTISANSSGSTKYDWVYISLNATNMANPNTAADNVATITTSRSSSANSDDGTPPTYSLLLAVVTVANGFSTITNSNISDRRTRSGANYVSTTTTDASWNTLGSAPSSVTYNGNRSYTCTFNNVDLSSTISAGMRLRTTRSTAAPTQCTSLNGTTQYYSKSSPAGMTFTDDFVVSAWIKLSSYNGAINMVASRWNGTSGWYLKVNADGTIALVGTNASAANYSQVVTYQSIPLNRWVHIAAQLDMSTFTATTTTSYVMINGVDVPASVSRAGTNPTALVQAGNLEIGSTNGGTLPFAGKIAQVAVCSAKVTQATIQGYISQGLAGTETSLISAYSFNNSINDLNTSNANDLTANGSAVATNADSPFGGQASGSISSTLDYGIVQSVTYSTNSTVVVQVPEGCTLPTSGGISTVVYSSNRVPYGMPAQRSKWFVTVISKGSETISIGSTTQWYAASGGKITIPIGEWVLSYQGTFRLGSSVSGSRSGFITLSSTAPTTADYSQEMTGRVLLVPSATAADATIYKSTGVSLSSQTTYSTYGAIDSATGTETWMINAAQGAHVITAENAYL